MATWVNKGWNQLTEYRNRRVQELEQRTGKREDCFHDGSTVLDAVGQSHDDIIASCRANDPVTPEVVKGIIGDMLLFQESARCAARPIYCKSRRIMNDAKARHTQSLALAAIQGAHPRSTQLKDPPNLPPNHQGLGSGESAIVFRPYSGPKVWGSKGSPSPEGNDQVYGASSWAHRQSDAYPDHHDQTYEQGSSTAAHLPPLRPVSVQSGYSSGRDGGRGSSYDHYNQRPEAHAILSDINNNGTGQVADNNDSFGDLSEVNHRVASNQALRGPNSHDRSFHTLSYPASNADQEDPSWGNASRDTPYSGPSKSPEATSSADLAAPENRKRATQLPEMSVNEGIVLKRQRGQFPREDLFVELQARDHVSGGYVPTQWRAKSKSGTPC